MGKNPELLKENARIKRTTRIKSANQCCLFTWVIFEMQIIIIDYHTIIDKNQEIEY